MGDRIVIASKRADRALALDATASLVWESLGDWKTASDVRSELQDAYPAVADTAVRAAVEAIVDELDDAGLLERPS